MDLHKHGLLNNTKVYMNFWLFITKLFRLIEVFIFAPTPACTSYLKNTLSRYMCSITPGSVKIGTETGMLSFWRNSHQWLHRKLSDSGSCRWCLDHSNCTCWRHQMETFSALLALCVGNSPVTGEFPWQMPATQSFDIFFDLRLNKRLSKKSK